MRSAFSVVKDDAVPDPEGVLDDVDDDEDDGEEGDGDSWEGEEEGISMMSCGMTTDETGFLARGCFVGIGCVFVSTVRNSSSGIVGL